MMKVSASLPRPSRPGFTLIELLTVIAIVGILAALIVPVAGRVRAGARRASGVSQLRQIGLALPLHAAEHRESLPGPLQAGQGPQHDPARPGQLATALGRYFGVREPTAKVLLPIFVPPAFAAAMSEADPAGLHPFVLFIQARQDGKNIFPWGDDKAPPRAPLRLSQIAGRTPALIDADQENPLVAGQPFAGKTTPRPYHGESRLMLRFDASVVPITSAELISLTAGGPAPPPPPPPPPPP